MVSPPLFSSNDETALHNVALAAEKRQGRALSKEPSRASTPQRPGLPGRPFPPQPKPSSHFSTNSVRSPGKLDGEQKCQRGHSSSDGPAV